MDNEYRSGNAAQKERVLEEEDEIEVHPGQRRTSSPAKTNKRTSNSQIPSQANHSKHAPTATPMLIQGPQTSSIPIDDLVVQESSLISGSLSQSPTNEDFDSVIQSPPTDTLSKLSVGPQTIPEARRIDHSLDEISPPRPPTRASSTSRFRGMSSNSLSRRQSRRSTSHNSPAQAFLSSWHAGVDAEPAPEPKPDDEGQSIGVNSEYIIGRTIGQGGFAVVKELRTRNERTGQEERLAVKIVRKQINNDDTANDKAQQELEHEVSVWRHLQHPHVLELKVVFETDFATYCVMDLNIGGTLHDIVRQQRQATSERGEKFKGLDSALAKHYAYQLASALRYLHEDIQVCHRDVKLENCLVDMTKGEYGHLRLCDFGLADFLHSRSIDEERDFLDDIDTQPRRTNTTSVIGTLEYASPRGLSVHRKLFETAGDVWAYGVIVYALCTGELPFRHAMPSKTIDAILRADWDGNALRLASSSGKGEEVYELVSGCLKKSIEERWTITDCIESPWFQQVRKDESALWQ